MALYSQNYRVIHVNTLHRCYTSASKLGKKNQILRICYSTVTWLYIEMKDQGNTTRANFLSSSNLDIVSPPTSQFLPSSLADFVSADSALGSRFLPHSRPGSHKTSDSSACPESTDSSAHNSASQKLPQEGQFPAGQGAPSTLKTL